MAKYLSLSLPPVVDAVGQRMHHLAYPNTDCLVRLSALSSVVVSLCCLPSFDSMMRMAGMNQVHGRAIRDGLECWG